MELPISAIGKFHLKVQTAKIEHLLKDNSPLKRQVQASLSPACSPRQPATNRPLGNSEESLDEVCIDSMEVEIPDVMEHLGRNQCGHVLLCLHQLTLLLQTSYLEFPKITRRWVESLCRMNWSDCERVIFFAIK